MIKVNDVAYDWEFIQEFEAAPESIQDRFNNKIDKSLNHGYLLSSFQAHRIENMWEGYINQDKCGWRVLFEEDARHCLHFLHILPHDEMMRCIREYVKYA